MCRRLWIQRSQPTTHVCYGKLKEATSCPINYPKCYMNSRDCAMDGAVAPWNRAPSPDTDPTHGYNFIDGYDGVGTDCTTDYQVLTPESTSAPTTQPTEAPTEAANILVVAKLELTNFSDFSDASLPQTVAPSLGVDAYDVTVLSIEYKCEVVYSFPDGTSLDDARTAMAVANDVATSVIIVTDRRLGAAALSRRLGSDVAAVFTTTDVN